MSTNGQMFCETALWRLAGREEYAYEFGPDQIVRYAALPPTDTMEETLAYLTGASGCSRLTLEGRSVTGVWKTLYAGWQPVGPEADGALRPLRLVHVIVPADASGSADAYVTENNCTWRVSVTPYFRQAAPGTAPAGSSGITYRITGERVDERTGEWQYQIERREQLTTTTGVITLEEDAFKTVYQQGWYGIRTGNKDHAGAAVALWETDGWPAGTTVRDVFIQKNDNCTTDIIQQKTVAKAVAGARQERTENLRERRAEVTDRNMPALEAEEVLAAGGVIERRGGELNADGTADNRRVTVTEQEVADSRTRTVRTADMELTETLHENAAAAAEMPAEAEGEEVELVRERTDGRLWTNTLVRRVARLMAGARRRVVKDKFETVEEDVDRGVASADKPAEIGEPAGGVWYEQLYEWAFGRKWDCGLTRHTEKHVAVARSAQVRTPLLTRARQEARNAPGVLGLAADEYGSADAEMTRGGLWSGGKELVTDTLGARAAAEYESHYLESREETQEVVAAEGSAGAVLSGRTLTRLTFRRTDGGGWLRTTLRRTVPEARQFTLTDMTTTGPVPPASGHDPRLPQLGDVMMSHTRTLLFLNAQMAQVKAAADAFMANKNGFVTETTAQRWFWSYETETGFGLRPDEFGTWTGTLTLRASLVNKTSETVASVGE